MSTVLTLVSSKPQHLLNDSIINQVIGISSEYSVAPTCAPVWLHTDKAADIGLNAEELTDIPRALIDHLHEALEPFAIDVFVNPIEKRRKKLLIADMDSTIISGETLDDLAEHAGLKDRIAEITTRAMNGELDFHEAIFERVKLLRGLSTQALKDTLQTLQTNPGARTFVKTMRENGCVCVLVSGGFTFFTEAVAKSLEFNSHHGNVLGIENDELTGQVLPPILDKTSKVHFLKDYMTRHNLKMDDCMAIGDGANDLPMLQEAGLGIGYKPKDTVRQGVLNSIIHGDLSTALYAQGYPGVDFYRNTETKL